MNSRFKTNKMKYLFTEQVFRLWASHGFEKLLEKFMQ